MTVTWIRVVTQTEVNETILEKKITVKDEWSDKEKEGIYVNTYSKYKDKKW